MYAEERRQEILQFARADGRVDVTALADRRGVTAETFPLADMYVDIAFLGTTGCSVQRGLTTPDRPRRR